MIFLETLFESGTFAWLILLVMGLELLAISAYYLITGKGIPPAHAFTTLGAGGAIVLAMGLLVDGAAGHWVALLLIVSMLIHWLDLANRWNTSSIG